MDGQPARSSQKILRAIFLGSFIFFPLPVSNYSMIQQDPLQISFSKNSPPLAAIEDEHFSDFAENMPENFSNNELAEVQLKTGSRKVNKTTISKILKIAADFSQEQEAILKVEATQESFEVRDLGGLTLDKNSVNIQLLRREVGLGAPARKVQFVKAKTQRTYEAPTATAIQEQEIELPRSDGFEDQAERIINGVEPTPIIRSVARVAPITSAQLAANFANNALVQRHSNTVAETSSPIQFKKVAPSAPVKPTRTIPPTSTLYATRSIHNAAVKKETLLSNPPAQALMGGTFEFAGGLAYTGNQKVAVYRQVAGNKTADGQVILSEGKFEIYVDHPESGMIVADMYDNDQIVGHGEILLASALGHAGVTGELRDLHMVLRPTSNAIQSHAISAYATLEKGKNLKAQMSVNDLITEKENLLPSSIISKVSKEGYWGSLMLGTSTQVFKNILYPDKNIEALKEILGINQEKNKMGIIRGIVKIMGNPVAGAQVEIVPSQFPADQTQKSVYFNSFIPDQSLNETTENGEYAFVGVAEGTYVIRANYKGKTMSPQVVPVENGFVTHADFNVEQTAMAEAYTFDLQNSEMVNAEIGFVGSEHFSPSSGRKLLSFSGAEGVQFLEARAQSDRYYSTRVTVDKSEKEILIPMVAQNWLTALTARLKVNSTPDGAIIVGTAPEVPYQIELDPKAYNDDTKIIYFGRNGFATEGATFVPPGGGFIALNVNPGLRSLFVNYQGITAKKVVTMAADNSVVSVFASKY